LEHAPSATADRLARTIGILRSATSDNPKVLKILFYGQSITSTKWTDQTLAHLRATYPNVRFVGHNRAIGGFSAVTLEPDVARDVAEEAPDLIVFHVYGNHHAYEQIIREFRSLTAAEIIIQDDHVTRPVEPICPEGLRLTVHVPPGCRGALWLRQNSWDDHNSGVILPHLADKYGLALAPRRAAWNAYLQRHGLSPDAMLVDGVHPNETGWRLMAVLFDRWFDHVVATAPAASQALVTDLPPPSPGQPRNYRIDGNRVELIADGPLDGKVMATMDGRAPAAIDGCWQDSRTTSLPWVPDWPAIRRVKTAPGFHAPERWTAVITMVDKAKSQFRFTLSGARTGADGAGQGDEDFTSASGRVRIAAEDWTIAKRAADHPATGAVPDRFVVRWQRSLACHDLPAVPLSPGRIEQRNLLAATLPNGPHDLKLAVSPGAPRLRAVRVYRPPLTDR
jgi:hypothetical protein